MQQTNRRNNIKINQEICSKQKIDTSVSEYGQYVNILCQKISQDEEENKKRQEDLNLFQKIHALQDNGDRNKHKLFNNSFIKIKVNKKKSIISEKRCKTSAQEGNYIRKQFYHRVSEGDKKINTASLFKNPFYKFRIQKCGQKKPVERQSFQIYRTINWEKTLREWKFDNRSLFSLSSKQKSILNKKMLKMDKCQQNSRRVIIFDGIKGKKAPISEITDFFNQKTYRPLVYKYLR